MKYFIYAVLMLLGYGISYGFFPLLLPVWLAADITLILVVCIAQTTKDYTAAVVGGITGILIDLYISPGFGVCTLFYALVGYLWAQVSARLKHDSFVNAMVAVILFYIIRDGGYMVYGFIYGSHYDYLRIFTTMTLASSILNGLLAFPLYLVVVKLHELHCMRTRRELDFLSSYREQSDWLANWFEQYK